MKSQGYALQLAHAVPLGLGLGVVVLSLRVLRAGLLVSTGFSRHAALGGAGDVVTRFETVVVDSGVRGTSRG